VQTQTPPGYRRNGNLEAFGVEHPAWGGTTRFGPVGLPDHEIGGVEGCLAPADFKSGLAARGGEEQFAISRLRATPE